MENVLDEISVLIVLDDKEINKEEIAFTDDLEYNQNVIMSIRNLNKNYYVKHNNDFVDEKIETNGNINISEYSPVVFITFDSYKSYLSEKVFLQKLSKSNDIEKKFNEKKFDLDCIECDC